MMVRDVGLGQSDMCGLGLINRGDGQRQMWMVVDEVMKDNADWLYIEQCKRIPHLLYGHLSDIDIN